MVSGWWEAEGEEGEERGKKWDGNSTEDGAVAVVGAGGSREAEAEAEAGG